jgi:hypothetical protein
VLILIFWIFLGWSVLGCSALILLVSSMARSCAVWAVAGLCLVYGAGAVVGVLLWGAAAAFQLHRTRLRTS